MKQKDRVKHRNRQGLFMIAQMILVKIGIAVQLLVLIFMAMHLTSASSIYMLISSILMLCAHVAALIYGYFGFRKSRVFYYVTIGFFLAAILVNIIMPFRDPAQMILLTLLFGIMCVFPFRQENYKLTNILILIAVVLALGFSIYSSITAKVDSINDSNKVFPAIIMYLSIFAPVIMVGLFGSAYNTRYNQHKLTEGK